jgi:predicted RNase H-like nuclease (RuvC/YqgF family)
MRFNNNDDSENDDEQSTTERMNGGQPSNQQPNGGQPMQGPAAASKRDVEEAERKADGARERAQMLEGECDELRARNEELREEIEELRELHAVHAVSLEYLFENASSRGLGKTLPDYEVPEPLEELVAEAKQEASEGGVPAEGE